nr:hypothetical protein [Actinospica robiniae]
MTMATEPAPGQSENEDFAGAVARAAVLLDGAGLPGSEDGGCVHGVAWYARRLGTRLLGALAQEDDASLTGTLSSAIGDVAGSHRATCDLGHPATPSATVVILRERGSDLDYLVLADSTLVFDGPQLEPTVVTDRRLAAIGQRYRAQMDALVGGSTEHAKARADYVAALRAHRNREGGFFVAAADPDAAWHAMTGSVPSSGVRTALLLSDGASRLNDRFKLRTWNETLELARSQGPNALIAAVRGAECADPQGRRWPRGKIFDDATVVLCDLV